MMNIVFIKAFSKDITNKYTSVLFQKYVPNYFLLKFCDLNPLNKNDSRVNFPY